MCNCLLYTGYRYKCLNGECPNPELFSVLRCKDLEKVCQRRRVRDLDKNRYVEPCESECQYRLYLACLSDYDNHFPGSYRMLCPDGPRESRTDSGLQPAKPGYRAEKHQKNEENTLYVTKASSAIIEDLYQQQLADIQSQGRGDGEVLPRLRKIMSLMLSDEYNDFEDALLAADGDEDEERKIRGRILARAHHIDSKYFRTFKRFVDGCQSLVSNLLFEVQRGEQEAAQTEESAASTSWVSDSTALGGG